MPEPISQLAEQIASQTEDTLTVSLRMGTVTAVETTGSLRVKTDTTGTAWLSRDRDTILTVGDKVWILKQGSVWLVGGRLAGGSATPVGTVNAYAGTTIPTGWLACSGQAVSRVTYAALYAAIGVTYGAGDGSTTFNVPNLTNRMAVGSGGTYTPGTTGGAATVTLTSGQIPAHDHGGVGNHNHGNAGSHTHTYPDRSIGLRSTASPTINTTAVVSGTATTDSAGDHSHGDAGAHTHSSFGGSGSHENMSPFLALPMIIRAL